MKRTMKISTMLTYGTDPREAADHVVRLEAAGLDTVWVAEGYGFDSPTLMGYLAARTSTVEIGAAILNVYSRTPTMLASTAAGLDSVSGGRAVIGLGASNPKIIEGWHGMPFVRAAARTKETVEIVRAALRREAVDHDGRSFQIPLPAGRGTGLGEPLKIMTKPLRPSVPLYVAALGPKSVEGAAEYADGWLPFLYSPEGAAEVWGDALAAGTAKRPGNLAPLEVVAGGIVAVGEDVKAALDVARPILALYIGGMGARGHNFFNDLVRRYGYEAEAEEIQDLYLDGRTKEAEAKVPSQLLEQFNLVGPASYVRERIEAFRESGVTNLQVTPIGADPAGLVRRLKEWVA
ncbi:Putative coenzyme F420-dependent oxidoreductase [Streptomyces sp. enrichment culture]